MTSDEAGADPEQDPDYYAAAALWNAMTQRQRQELVLVVQRLSRLLDRDVPDAGPPV